MPPIGSFYKGIILILTATLGIILMNTCAKVAGLSHNPLEMLFYRGLIALSLLVPYMLIFHSWELFKTRRIKTHLYRGIAGNLGVGFVFWAYSRLPMADVTAILFAAPLFVTALSPLLLNEKVNGVRWTAVAIGFTGTLLITQPSMSMLSNPSAFIGIAAAFFVALVDMALRNLGRTDHPLTTVFYFILFGVIISTPYALIFGSFPSGRIWPWMMGIGIFTAIQQVAKTTAYRFAEASVLAPYTYTAIIWATLTGWLLWNDLPTLPVIVGTIIVISSNLYAIWYGR